MSFCIAINNNYTLIMTVIIETLDLDSNAAMVMMEISLLVTMEELQMHTLQQIGVLHCFILALMSSLGSSVALVHLNTVIVILLSDK